MSYRTGRHLGRTIYRVGIDGYEALIGIMDTPEDGELVAEALNARERVLAARGTFAGSPHPESPTRDMTVPQSCEDREGQPVASDVCELNVPHYVTTLGVPHGLVRGRAEVPPPGPHQADMRTCGRVGMHNCGVTGRWQSHDTGVPLPDPDEPPPVLLEPTGWEEPLPGSYP